MNRDQWLAANGFTSYPAYLKSPLWSRIKSRHFKNRKNLNCKTCGSDKDIQVHHTSYSPDVMSGLNIKSLKTLCRACHYLYEFTQDGRKLPIDRVNSRINKRIKRNKKKLIPKQEGCSLCSREGQRFNFGRWVCQLCSRTLDNKNKNGQL